MNVLGQMLPLQELFIQYEQIAYVAQGSVDKWIDFNKVHNPLAGFHTHLWDSFVYNCVINLTFDLTQIPSRGHMTWSLLPQPWWGEDQDIIWDARGGRYWGESIPLFRLFSNQICYVLILIVLTERWDTEKHVDPPCNFLCLQRCFFPLFKKKCMEHPSNGPCLNRMVGYRKSCGSNLADPVESTYDSIGYITY